MKRIYIINRRGIFEWCAAIRGHIRLVRDGAD